MVNPGEPPDFRSRDSGTADFWSERFEHGFTPWERGDVPLALQDFVQRSQHRFSVLIPGCGSGREVACMVGAGWEVTAIDFSLAAVRAAREALGDLGHHVHPGDFFSFQPKHTVNLIYERAFLCALPPKLRPAIVRRWASLLPPDGLVAGFFLLEPTEKGPPYGMTQAQLDGLMEHAFERIEDAPVLDSVPVFSGKERWQVWRRTRKMLTGS